MKSLKNHLESLGHIFNQNNQISINIIRMFLINIIRIYLEVGRGGMGIVKETLQQEDVENTKYL